MQEVIQKQFEIAGHKVIWKDIPEDGLIEVKKKKRLWYEVYKFKDLEEYEQWRKYLEEKLGKYFKDEELRMEVNYIDLRYGMTYNVPKEIKEGQLDLPF